MSLISYNKAISLIESHPDMVTRSRGVSRGYALDVMSSLGFFETEQYFDFLTSFGDLTFGGVEIYGLLGVGNELGLPSVKWYVDVLRNDQSVNLPLELLPIYDLGDGEIFCLDYRSLYEGAEPPVVAFSPGSVISDQQYDIIADDFGDFIYEWFLDEMDNVSSS